MKLLVRNPNFGGGIWGVRFQAGREGRNGQLKRIGCCRAIRRNERARKWPNFDPGQIVAGESRWNWELTTAGGFSALEISIATSCRQRWKTRLVARSCCWTAFRRNSRPSGRCWPLLAWNRPKSTWCFKSTCRNEACQLRVHTRMCCTGSALRAGNCCSTRKAIGQRLEAARIASCLLFLRVPGCAARISSHLSTTDGVHRQHPQQEQLRDVAVHNQLFRLELEYLGEHIPCNFLAPSCLELALSNRLQSL